MEDLNQRVDQVRRFNRLYTRRIRVLQDGYLNSPFSLAEVRVLYELAHHPGVTATELTRALELDPGYLSRILRKFDDHGFVQRERSARDGRESHLRLTLSGETILAPLEAASRAEISALLSRLSEHQQQRFLGALQQIEALIDEASPSPGFSLRTEPKPGDFGWVVQRHGALYAEEYGFDLTFESLVAGIVAKFVDHFDPERERVWIAERMGQPVGCVFLVKASRRVAKLRLFLVEPDARGLGIGKTMVRELIVFARAAGYYSIRLWTQSILLAARHVYAEAGFVKIAEEPNHAFGHELISETWELRL